MTWSVYQHWDPLKVCVVGRSYPPEFYSWIKEPHVRKLFERIAIETEEDFQGLIKKLNEFDVQVLRPDLPDDFSLLQLSNGKYCPPPMTPRDYMIMIGNEFFYPKQGFNKSYNLIKDKNWPECQTWQEFKSLPTNIQEECLNVHHLNKYETSAMHTHDCFNRIEKLIKEQGNTILKDFDPLINGAMVARIGRDLYFGTDMYTADQEMLKRDVSKKFINTRNHVINTGGHADGTYCPVCPGLIISLHDVPSYAETFPGWEVVYLPNQSWEKVLDFLKAKEQTNGRWWIPGFEQDQAVTNVVETWLDHWVGYVEETVFDVNMLIVDPKNVIVLNHNQQVFDALDRYGITAHVVPFRHRYFWDGGIHCITTDLHREGTMQDYFPNGFIV